jgi:integrase
MATVAIKIHKHHKKADGTYNVKIRITHKREKKYIDTPHFVVDKQITAKCTLKDAGLKVILNSTLLEYRKIISDLGSKLDLFSADSLRSFLLSKNEPMNFLKFCKDYIVELEKNGKGGSAGTLKTVLYSLQDYFNQPSISPLEISESMLSAYEKYLRAERKIIRLNQGKMRTRKVKGMNDAAVHNHFRDLRILFKASMKFFNKPQIGEIKISYCPFDNYKIVEAPETRKRNTDIETLKLIRDCPVEEGSRAELARDLYVLSFYLCGMNAVDFYNLQFENIRKNRVDYNRAKTKNRRKDRAFISIKIVNEAKPLLEKYLGKLSVRYNSSQNLDRAINAGMKIINKKLKLIGVTFYWARHTFGNLARNKCRLSVDDIALALNHVEKGNKTTDIYIEKDWNIVDEVQASVITLLKNEIVIRKNKIAPSIPLQTRKGMYVVQ